MLANRQSPWPKRIDRWLGVPLIYVMALLRPFFLWRRRRQRPATRPRVLVIKLSALGDLVTMFPALYLLGGQLQGAQFDFLGGTANEPLARELKLFTGFYRLSRKSVFAIFQNKYDLVVDFDQWVRTTALVASVSGARHAVGFKSKGQHRHAAYDQACPFDTNKHNGENFWNLARLGIEVIKREAGGGQVPKAEISGAVDVAAKAGFEHDRLAVRKNWRSLFDLRVPEQAKLGEPYVVLHPGCGEHGKLREWPVESWRNLVGALKTQKPELQIFITGHGEYEVNLAQRIAEAGGVSLAGKLNLLQLMALLTGAANTYCCNTGIMHLANFFSDHVVSINGPTNPSLWGPLWFGRNVNSPLRCSPCLTWGYDYGCSDPVCVKVIKSQEVLQTAHA